MRKLTVMFLSGLICLVGALSAFAITYNESPMLKTMVAAGEIPRVELRLPEEPQVFEPFEEIGQYGGTIRVFAVNPNAWNDLQPGIGGQSGLFRTTRDGATTIGNIAKGFEWSEDLKTFTIYLRKGTKWSDGAPFTVDDIIFHLEDVYGNEELTPMQPSFLTTGGKFVELERVNAYTLKLHFATTYSGFEMMMRTYRGWQTHMYAPKHYLTRWHIKYNPKADELAKEEGYEYWWEAYKYHAQNFPQQEDLNLPRMLPWVIKEKTTSVLVFERNPYYWSVDTAGNQLPYIDTIVSPIVDKEVYQLKVISGEADFAETNLSLSNYTLYAENEEEGNYRVILGPGPDVAQSVVSLNLNEEDPVLREICQDLRFRQALSVAINRDDINESLFFGRAVPMQVVPYPTCSYYKKEWGEYYVQYDPDLANQLLDEMGLTERDRGDFRLRPDGKRLGLTIEYWGGRNPVCTPILELIKEYWEAVGVQTVLKSQERALFNTRQGSSAHGVMEWDAGWVNEVGNFSKAAGYFSPPGGTSFAHEWGVWLKTGGESGEEPPEDIKEHYNQILEWQATRPGSPEYMALADKIFDFFSKQLWYIGTVGLAPTPCIVKNNLGNVPDPTKDFASGGFPQMQDFALQFFFKR